MQGANEYVKAGQAFVFGVAAQLGAYDVATFTYDNTIRLRIAGALQRAATDVAVEFETDSASRSAWTLLKIAGRSRTDRAHGYDIRDDCLRAAQDAGLIVNNSQADINIIPAGSNVGINYNFQNVGGGNNDDNDPSGLPSVETMFMVAIGLVLVTRFLRG